MKRPSMDEQSSMMKAKELLGWMIRSEEGEVGKVTDLLFDTEDWVVRYVVVDTWEWLPDRVVIIPAAVLKRGEAASRCFDLPVTKKAVADGSITTPRDQLSRAAQESLLEHYRLAPYWMARVPGGAEMAADESRLRDGSGPGQAIAPMSFTDATGYQVVARDGAVGHVSDLTLDERSWRVETVLVDTSNWLGGGAAAVPAGWITRLDAEGNRMTIDKTREQIQNDPGYHPVPGAAGPRPRGRARGGAKGVGEDGLQLDLDLEDGEDP